MSFSGDTSTQIYSIGFCGASIETTVTNSCHIVEKWVNSIFLSRFHRNQIENYKLLVGLSTQCRPRGHHGTYNTIRPDVVVTLQLCVGQHCLVFLLLHADAIPRSLIEFLRDVRIGFVGMNIKRHVEKLLRDWGLKVSYTIDMAEMAEKKYNDGRRKNLEDLLNFGQVEQASIEAYMSFLLGLKLAADDHHGTVVADEVPILENCSSSVPIPIYNSSLIDDSYV